MRVVLMNLVTAVHALNFPELPNRSAALQHVHSFSNRASHASTVGKKHASKRHMDPSQLSNSSTHAQQPIFVKYVPSHADVLQATLRLLCTGC
jgi:hypothetical protein